MADYIFRSDGSPAGFRLGAHIYTLDGVAVAQVFAERAYDLSGRYVGTLVNNMVLDKPGGPRGDLRRLAEPAQAAAAFSVPSRLPVHEQFEDCFYLLEMIDPEEIPPET